MTMTNDGFEQLSAISGLSRQKDGISLTRALIDSLRQLSPGVNVAILEVHGHGHMEMPGAAGVPANDLLDQISVRRFDESGQRVARRECVSDVAVVIARLQPAAVESEARGVGRLVIPLSGDVGPLRLVVIDDIPIDPWVRAKLMQVVEVYGNLIRLMDSRERDALTGLLNRQTFAMLFEMAVERNAHAAGQVLALAVLDIDHFKRVNDTFGHLYGDEVLIHFARLMQRSFRYTDDLFRFGGEEFVALLSVPAGEAARGVLDRFRHVVEQYDFPGVGRVTASIGYVGFDGRVLPTTLVDQADQALYHAKGSGRNRVVDYAELTERAPEGAGDIDLF